ncbi:GntR family transcriptional regulator [Lactiplantibacillus plantarum]|nr:GntR family transcriptional regulator [Lactiplantibacillus plantarum]
MYQAIAQAIIKSIMADEYPTKLPTEKVLMAQYNASRNTIRKAIDVVFRHGLLRRVQGAAILLSNNRRTRRKCSTYRLDLTSPPWLRVDH